MTRKKKSRKVINNGTARLSKDKLRELRALKELRAKKKTKGAQAGNRNSQLLKVESTEAKGGASGDNRVGSKKPVSLTPEAVTAQPQKPQVRKDLKPQAVLSTYIEPELTPEQELEQLESDERLLALIERHDNGEILQGKDAKYFNAKVERHQQLCEILGLDDDDFEDDEDLLDDYMNDSLADEWLDDEDEK
ncbi:Der GTPase-activating protein YihI [Pseudoalteromonas sp. BDTF-M6]|uniref:Der GTPase-activating protein YihI n=1 Tax=Pseudoalteromonas sp. BDTF-M6 TaxID=2796132 RepID=UPI001BB0B3F4|nr:Der GTPase-activating protein YihI [Pseudoalteromonas sp. BDTF-M6]MBS3799132.1 GTPase-activating protein [Pseudoalteromonas sp. BDTF-M6]